MAAAVISPAQIPSGAATVETARTLITRKKRPDRKLSNPSPPLWRRLSSAKPRTDTTNPATAPVNNKKSTVVRYESQLRVMDEASEVGGMVAANPVRVYRFMGERLLYL